MARQGVTAPPDVVATALTARAQGATLEEAGKRAGVSHVAVSHYENGKRPRALERVTEPLLQAKRWEFTEEWSELRKRAVARISDAKLKKASALQLATVAGIADDKIERLRQADRVGAGVNALAQLVALPEGRQVLSNMAGLLAQAIRLQRELPEPVIEAEYEEKDDSANLQSRRGDGEEGPEASERKGRRGAERL